MAFWLSSFGSGSASSMRTSRGQTADGWLSTLPYWMASMSVQNQGSYYGYNSGQYGWINIPSVLWRGVTIRALYADYAGITMVLGAVPADKSQAVVSVNGTEFTLSYNNASGFVLATTANVFKQYLGVTIPVTVK